MTKKDFNDMDNPANINPADTSLDGLDGETPTVKPEQGSKDVSHEGKTRKPADERKSERLGLLVKPMTAHDIKLIAQLENTSMNDIANQLLTDYIAKYQRKHPDKLEAARQLFK